MQKIPNRQDSPLLNVQQIRQLEQALFAYQDSYDVMIMAAKALFDVVTSDYPTPLSNQQVRLVFGCGNNAGDGLLLAAYLRQAGFSVMAYHVFPINFQGDAAKAYAFAVEHGVVIEPFAPFVCGEYDILLEGLFGIGFDRAANGTAKAAIDHLNTCKQQQPNTCLYAIDLPAGIVADTGAALGSALVADKTITFIADKIGLHTAAGRGCAGQVIVKTLGAEAHLSVLNTPPLATAVRHYHYLPVASNANQNTHKGDYGHSLTVGGGQGMFGAVALAAISALKVGTGKSSIYAHADYQCQYHLQNTPLYEVMRCLQLSDLSPYSAVVLGPGLGRDAWGQSIFQQTASQCHQAQLAANLALLIDADGLFQLAAIDDITAAISVITPHEAEAAKLLHIDIEQVRRDKLSAVKQLASRYQCVAVLKGSGTLISDGQQVWVNSSGNYYLATAGTGDVLAGIIGGYLAQGLSAIDAALYGVYQHGLAANHYLAQHPNKSLRASELWDFL